MEQEGIVFRTNMHVGVTISARELQTNFDAVLLAGGASSARDLPIPGRELKGIHFAMDFLPQQNKRVAGDVIKEPGILATSKKVLVIGGGDTGSDCVGTSNRQGAAHVAQIELLAKPPITRSENNPWPQWPMILTTSSSHEEGVNRQWAILTKEFIGNSAGQVIGLKVVDITWGTNTNGKMGFEEIAETERVIECDLVLLAIGFTGAEQKGMVEELKLELDDRGNIKSNNYQTNQETIFSAGDMRRGQSLVVWAISEGREAARAIDIHLMGTSSLESKDDSMLKVSQPL
jgi:glutamate synthase (NADPH/NADH) small chain